MQPTQGQAPEPDTSQVDTSQTASPEVDSPKTYDEEYVKRLRREAAQSRTRLNELEAAEKARSMEAMTETERLKAELAEAKQAAKAREIEALKLRAATKHGLADDLMEFLTGEDEATIIAQAEKLAARLKANSLPESGKRSPGGGGAEAQQAAAEERIREDLARRIPAVGRRVALSTRPTR